jgi:hypothetical protein
MGWDQLDKTSRKFRDSLSSCKNFPEDSWDVRDLFCAPEEGDRGEKVDEDGSEEVDGA